MEISKSYNQNNVEQKWYKKWEDSGSFSPSSGTAESFTIMIPPPNVTGILHIGHILNNTIQDILVRRARMQGKRTLWLPGTDHASIATEAKVTKMLESRGIDKSSIGREKFLDHAMEWKEEYGGTILMQLRRLGASCDWSRTSFTMDPGYSNSVLEAFVRLYNDGLIYRGEKLINWDPKGQTALSDEEVVHKEHTGSLWYFRYPVKDSDDYIVVATTRPETMLGDTGVAVNPSDDRYKNLVGHTVVLPISGREIPIFSDSYVDKDFGTGCVKVTPAHDPNDFDMGTRNNLEVINIMNPDSSLNNNVPPSYEGLYPEDARTKIVKEMEGLELLDKVERHSHQVGHSERTDAIVQPYISKQWFMNMEKLTKPALKAVKNGQINFYPERWTKTYNHWLENIRDWCISRQLWWGHRIPVWYREDEIYCGTTPPVGDGWQQDEDVLDTWFSSWLWPFATLGWPDETNDLKDFYPTQSIVTGPDIIFFWVARMIMAGIYFRDEIPFSNVCFNGIIRDEKGRKMSKSLGNSPDPVELMDEYGSDALRVGILMIAPTGLDILFSKDKIEHGRNFVNKLWNSARFILMNKDKNFRISSDFNLIEGTTNIDRWIVSRLETSIGKIDKYYNQYRLNDALKTVYDFTRKDFCDWYIEFAKIRLYGDDPMDREVAFQVSSYVLRNILKLLHPFAPFVTEELWSYLKTDKEDMILTESYPMQDIDLVSDSIEEEVEIVKNIISSVRNVRADLNIPPSKEADLAVRVNSKVSDLFDLYQNQIKRLARVGTIAFGKDIKKPRKSATAVVDGIEIFIPLEGLIDLEAEIKRLEKQIDDMQARLDNVNKKLGNENFVSRAPKEVIRNERDKQKRYRDNLDKLKANLNSLI